MILLSQGRSDLSKPMAQLIIAREKIYLFSVAVLKFLLVNSVNNSVEQVPQDIFCS